MIRSQGIGHWPASRATATTAADPTDQRQMSAPTSMLKKNRASVRIETCVVVSSIWDIIGPRPALSAAFE
ncbi:hypothetical protein [Streptomyces brevispora]|uniref:hypothetical protein n=1 Tax=Streptomyces brevispora TaxID=887462 RepID=UPI0035DA25DF